MRILRNIRTGASNYMYVSLATVCIAIGITHAYFYANYNDNIRINVLAI